MENGCLGKDFPFLFNVGEMNVTRFRLTEKQAFNDMGWQSLSP